jgi:hypothetical protein
LSSKANSQVQSYNADVQKSGNGYDSNTKSLVSSAANAASRANDEATSASNAAQSYVNQAKSATDSTSAESFRNQASQAASLASSAANVANSIANSVYNYLYGNSDTGYGYISNSESANNNINSNNAVDGYTKLDGIKTPFMIYVKQALFEHNSPNFSEDNAIREESSNEIFDAPELEVVAVYRGKDGLLRFKLKNGRYVTASPKYVGHLYLNDHKINKLYVIVPTGIWEHSSTKFSKKNRVRKLSAHTSVKVQGLFIGKDGMTRFVLENGNFITGNVECVSTKDFTKNEKW